MSARFSLAQQFGFFANATYTHVCAVSMWQHIRFPTGFEASNKEFATYPHLCAVSMWQHIIRFPTSIEPQDLQTRHVLYRTAAFWSCKRPGEALAPLTSIIEHGGGARL
ncbi:hypothetical protein EDC01DRAFT_636230 [Geopyxis carbonaria]|nr:hypothetical protein EDC01DRAFT_636230 [Geopyxis carbonaria]